MFLVSGFSVLVFGDSRRTVCHFNLPAQPASSETRDRERLRSFILLPCSSPAALLK
jgi:hypothetical protein